MPAQMHYRNYPTEDLSEDLSEDLFEDSSDETEIISSRIVDTISHYMKFLLDPNNFNSDLATSLRIERSRNDDFEKEIIEILNLYSESNVVPITTLPYDRLGRLDNCFVEGVIYHNFSFKLEVFVTRFINRYPQDLFERKIDNSFSTQRSLKLAIFNIISEENMYNPLN